MRIAIYSRKSKFTGKGESIENQIEMCYDYISRNIPRSTKEDIFVFEDEGFSGKSLNRPQFKKMMDIENKVPFDYIVVYRLDRISRNVGDFAMLIDRLNSYKTSFICIKEQFDTSTPMGRAMMNIAAVFAQLERETIAERVKDNMYMLARMGRWLGGTTPLGFSSEQVTYTDEKGVQRKCFRLTENPEQIETVKLIFKKYCELRSMKKLETFLLNHNIRTQNNCQFYVATIRSILTNPVYCTADEKTFDYFDMQGCDMAANRSECSGENGFIGYSKTESSAAGRSSNDISKWIIAVGRHKGIIPGEQWIETQKYLSENTDTKPIYRRAHNPVALLSGVLMCSCGSYMRPKYYRENKKGIKPYAYMCELKEKSKKQQCECPNLNGMAADNIICRALLDYDVPDSFFGQYLSRLSAHKPRENTEELIKKQEAAKAQKQKSISNLVRTLAADVDESTVHYINKEIGEINREISGIDREIARLRSVMTTSDNTENKLDSTEKALKYFKENFDHLSTEYKRKFIRERIKKIIWDGEKLNIFLRGR